MKIFKRGFSLAELLLAVGIIGVITAMGMTITKHTADNAYRGYWYTGYINLYNAIGDFNSRQLFDESAGEHQINDVNSMARELRIIFNATGNGNEVIARNGISYEINNLTHYMDDVVVYEILMSVPQPKNRQNPAGSSTAMLAYIQNEGLLMPIAGGDVNLQIRRDLLPTYYNTGIINDNRIKTEASKTYLSYQGTYCNNHDSSYTVSPEPRQGRPITSIILINCDNTGTENINGIIQVVNPAKVK